MTCGGLCVLQKENMTWAADEAGEKNEGSAYAKTKAR